jgi:hypothetical protein
MSHRNADLQRMLMQVIQVQQQQASLLARRPPSSSDTPDSLPSSEPSESDFSSHDVSPVPLSSSRRRRPPHPPHPPQSLNPPFRSLPVPPLPGPMSASIQNPVGSTAAPQPKPLTPRHKADPPPKFFSSTSLPPKLFASTSRTSPPSHSTGALQVQTQPSPAAYREPRTPVSGRSMTSDSSESSSGNLSQGLLLSPRGQNLSSSLKVKPVRTYLSPSIRPTPYPSPSANPLPTLEAWKFPGQPKGKRRSSKAVQERTPSDLPFPHTSNSVRSMFRIAEGGRRYYTKAGWRVRGIMTEPRSLLLPPFAVPELRMPGLHGDYVPPDPNQSDDTRAALDAFTRTLWERHQHAVLGDHRKSLYGVKSLMPDSYYIHIVKELHQPGHLERSGLPSRDLEVYNSIKNKINRNVRFMLFDIDPTAAQSCGMDRDIWCVPMLYIVNRTAAAKEEPSPDDCKRVFPISQVRALLERLHKDYNCRAVGIEKKVAMEFIGITRDTARFFQQYCLTCKEHQPLDHRQKVVQSIRSTHPRHRYVIDLIQMTPCFVRHEGTYNYILVMVDHFSRHRWTAPLQEKYASSVVKELRQWWSFSGKPDILQSDNGPEFAAGEVKDFCREWGVRKCHSRPYTPQTNGAVERANRDVQERLARWLTRNPGKTWVEGLTTVCAAHNDCWSRTHNGKPREVFNNAVCDGWRLMAADESMLPEEDGSEPSTASEGEQLNQIPQDEEDEDKEEGEECDDDWLHRPSHSDSDMNCDDVAGPGAITSSFMSERKGRDEAADRIGASQPQQAVGQSTNESPIISRTLQQSAGRSQPKGEQVEEAKLKSLKNDIVMKEKNDSQPSPLRDYGDEEEGSVVEIQHPLIDYAENVPDEKSPPLDLMGIVPAGEMHDMRYPQWKRFSEQLWTKFGRAGVPGLGDCGVIATVAAHQSFFLNGISPLSMTDEDIMFHRRAALELLDDKSALRLVAKEQRFAVTLDELRSTIRGLRTYVAVEYLWLYAIQHCLNIYLIEINVVNQVTHEETRSSFSMRLFTPEKFSAQDPVASDKPNTIAIYFHNIATYEDHKKSPTDEEEEKKTAAKSVKKPHVGSGTGHFEYLVDKESRTSCWRTSDDVVKCGLQVALAESYRINYLNHYTDKWVQSHNRITNHRLPEIPVGDIAMLMVSDYMRDHSTYSKRDGTGLRNMVVKVLRKMDSATGGPARYEVLSHAGVLTQCPLRQELRPLGQDVDIELRAKEVTLEDRCEGNKVGMMQAWDFFLQRRRGRHQDVAQRRNLPQPLLHMAAVEPLQEVASNAVEEVGLPLSGDSETAEPESQQGADAAASESTPVLTLLCCSCEGVIHLPRGQSPSVCMGLCQQPMHGNPGRCKESKRWVRVGDMGVCCSQACAVLYTRAE